MDATLNLLLEREDTDQNCQITVEDAGPKVLSIPTANSGGYNTKEIRGTYQLSNLLQELTLAKRFGRKRIVLDEERLIENPVSRLHRLIANQFWKSLTRKIDIDMIDIISQDPKNRGDDKRPRIFIPYGLEEQFEYYTMVAKAKPKLDLQIEYLSANLTPEYVKSLNKRPGLLALALEKTGDDDGDVLKKYRGVPYVVPGGRFNELYGWDSYMESLGLIADGKVDLAKGMVDNFCFEINHYGKILNANRSYYLSRSQPPFLTNMAIIVYEKIKNEKNALEFLRKAFKCAIKEYRTIWMAQPRLDIKTGLSRYRPNGLGIPPETEPSHFDTVLKPYAEKYKVSLQEFQELYNDGKVKEPDLDEYFMHDRGVRESGHDTSYRLEGVCGDLATVDLNSLLYKYETDIACVIKKYFDDQFILDDGSTEISKTWEDLAQIRKKNVNKYLWDEMRGLYFDYNTITETQSSYESATTFWPMWANLASEYQAESLVNIGIPMFEMFGGIVSGTEKSRGKVGIDRPNRQWDYPYGWAPQQILVWDGLLNYGYHNICERLVYRWLYMITKSFVDYNGVVVEKYDVTNVGDSHRVDAEYGNQGLDFKGVATEGFGWVNASYSYGLSKLSNKSRRILGALTPPDIFLSKGVLEEGISEESD